MATIHIGQGLNVAPEKNLPSAVKLLRDVVRLTGPSPVYRTSVPSENLIWQKVSAASQKAGQGNQEGKQGCFHPEDAIDRTPKKSTESIRTRFSLGTVL